VIDRTLLPVERILHATPTALIGWFECGPDHPLFRDSGPARNHLFVFPRTTVAIRHEGQAPFVSTPHNVTLYNRGQHYTRQALEKDGRDACDYFAVAEDVLLDAMRIHDPSVADRPDRPFRSAWTWISAGLFRRQRALVASLRYLDAETVDEAAIEILDRLLAEMFGSPRRAATRGATRDRIEFAKERLATNLDQALSLRDLAAACGTSPFHLCKMFRRSTGMTMTAFRRRVRLRLAFDAVSSSDDLLTIALGLGFSSHSHFTQAFRAHFGVTPSEVRRRKG
jgi:AraC-like DNA-binding protein